MFNILQCSIDYTVLDLSHIAEHFRCSVCTGLVNQAVILRSCEHIFCSHCIESVVATDGDLFCPDCRTQFLAPEDIIQPYRNMRQVLDSFRISCSHDGCQGQIGYD